MHEDTSNDTMSFTHAGDSVPQIIAQCLGPIDITTDLTYEMITYCCEKKSSLEKRSLLANIYGIECSVAFKQPGMSCYLFTVLANFC